MYVCEREIREENKEERETNRTDRERERETTDTDREEGGVFHVCLLAPCAFSMIAK